MRETLLGMIAGLTLGLVLIHQASPDFFTVKHLNYLHETVQAK